MSDRRVTQRIADEKQRESNVLARIFLRLFFQMLERWFVGNEEVLFEGGAVRKRKRGADVSWASALGSIDGAEYPRHPLCALGPLEKAGSAAILVGSQVD